MTTSPGYDPSTVLAAAAAVLLPGDDTWPAAGDLHLGAVMADIAGRHELSRTLLETFADAAPAALTDPATDDATRTAALVALEGTDPLVFGALRAVAYEAYYTHPSVQEVLALRCGLRPGPAQPQGYPQVFSVDTIPDLRGVRARGLQWRDDGTPTCTAVRAAQESDLNRQWSEEEIWQWQR